MCISKNRGRAFDLRSPPQQRVYTLLVYIYIIQPGRRSSWNIKSRLFTVYFTFILQAIFYAFYTHVLCMRCAGVVFSPLPWRSFWGRTIKARRGLDHDLCTYIRRTYCETRAEATVGITAAVIESTEFRCGPPPPPTPYLLSDYRIYIYRLSSSALLAHNNYYL